MKKPKPFIKIVRYIMIFYFLAEFFALILVYLLMFLKFDYLQYTTKIWISILFILLISFICYRFFIFNFSKPIARYEEDLKLLYEAKQKEFETTLSGKQAALSSLQSQINPHFLYNTLDSIRGQAVECNIPEIAEMTEALSSFFRYSVSQSGSTVPLRDELRNVEIYFKIQQYRFMNRFELIISYDSITSLDYHLPKLTLQPVVENSIYHGLEMQTSKGVINIRVISMRNAFWKSHVSGN